MPHASPMPQAMPNQPDPWYLMQIFTMVQQMQAAAGGQAGQGTAGHGPPQWDQNTRNQDKDLPPEWDGKDPAKNLRPYLKSLRFWKQGTVVPLRRLGAKLYQSLPLGSLHRSAVELIPEEQLMSERCYDLVVGAIEACYESYLKLDLELMTEDVIFPVQRQRNMSFT